MPLDVTGRVICFAEYEEASIIFNQLCGTPLNELFPGVVSGMNDLLLPNLWPLELTTT